MKVTNNNITLKFDKKFDFDEEEDDHTFYTISAHFNDDSIASEPLFAHSTIRKNLNDIIANFVLAKDLIEASQVTSEVNEILVMQLLSQKPKVIENLCTTLSFALTEHEKVMTIFGESNYEFTTMLTFEDIKKDLHYYAKELEYSKAIQMNDYELSKWFVLIFMNRMQECIIDCGRENAFKEELETFDNVYLDSDSVFNNAIKNKI